MRSDFYETAAGFRKAFVSYLQGLFGPSLPMSKPGFNSNRALTFTVGSPDFVVYNFTHLHTPIKEKPPVVEARETPRHPGAKLMIMRNDSAENYRDKAGNFPGVRSFS